MAVTLQGSCPNYVGLSTDDKPMDCPVNSLFTELDTKKEYYFDGEEWQEVGGGDR